jgi:LysR family transcriptional activator of nhaA
MDEKAGREQMKDELNYHHLRYFWVVAKEGSIAAATRVLGVSQPTVSAQLQLLEKALDAALFVRSGRNLVLTEVGQQVFRYAGEIFALGRELTEALAGSTEGLPQRFSVGVSDSLPKLTSYRLLRPAFQGPETFRVLVRIDKLERLIGDLSVHALDLVLVDQPVPPTLKVRSFSHLLGECGVSVFAEPNLARRLRPRFPRSLHAAPMLLQTENTALRRSLNEWFERQEIRPAVVAEVEDVALLQTLGQHGLGAFAAPSIVEDEIRQQYGVELLGRIPEVEERFYAISVDRRLKHPAVLAISKAARTELFARRL